MHIRLSCSFQVFVILVGITPLEANPHNEINMAVSFLIGQTSITHQFARIHKKEELTNNSLMSKDINMIFFLS